jgi:hypothetical protein
MRIGCRELVEGFQGSVHLAEGDATAFAGEARDPADGGRLVRRVVGFEHQKQHLHSVGQGDDVGEIARGRPYCGEVTAGNAVVEAGADDGEGWWQAQTYVRMRAGRTGRGTFDSSPRIATPTSSEAWWSVTGELK